MDETEYKPEDWARLASQVKQRRVSLDLTQTQVNAAGGPSVSVLSRIETARGASYDDIAIARLEKVLRWRAGSIHRILQGEDPQPISDTTAGRSDLGGDTEARVLLGALGEDEQAVGQLILMAVTALQKEVAGLREEVRHLRSGEPEEDSEITESEPDNADQRGTRGA